MIATMPLDKLGSYSLLQPDSLGSGLDPVEFPLSVLLWLLVSSLASISFQSSHSLSFVSLFNLLFSSAFAYPFVKHSPHNFSPLIFIVRISRLAHLARPVSRCESHQLSAA